MPAIMMNGVKFELPDVPDKLPLSGARGGRNLGRLLRRARHLEGRIKESVRELYWDKSELAALGWAIRRIMELENRLRTEREEGNEGPA